MFPRRRGHYGTGCDKSDNDFSPPRRAILGGVGSGKTGYIPLFWLSGSRVGAEGLLRALSSVSLTMWRDFGTAVRVTGRVRCRIFQFNPILFGIWVGGFRGGSSIRLLRMLGISSLIRQAHNIQGTTNTPDRFKSQGSSTCDILDSCWNGSTPAFLSIVLNFANSQKSVY